MIDIASLSLGLFGILNSSEQFKSLSKFGPDIINSLFLLYHPEFLIILTKPWENSNKVE